MDSRASIRRLLYAAAAVAGLLLVGATMLELVRSGWFSRVHDNGIDPTTRTFAVRLYNDSSVTITLKQCDSTCSTFHEELQLGPGGSTTANTSDENVNNYWLVLSNSGTRLGCLDLKYDHKVFGEVVKTSTAGPCP
jgi:hypothetical protein